MPKEKIPNLEAETELYPKKPFEEMKADILSGRWRNMKDVYWPGKREWDMISECAENGHIILRNIKLGWDDENRKVINKIIEVSETIFDKKKAGENKAVGYVTRNENGEKFWDSRDEFDEHGLFKKHTIKDGKGNLLRVEEKEDKEKTNIIYYDQGGKEGLRMVISHWPGSNHETRTYKDANGEILEVQEWDLLPSKHMKRRMDKDGKKIKLEYNEEHYQAKDYVNPYYFKGYGSEAAAGYEKRMHEVWKKGYQV